MWMYAMGKYGETKLRRRKNKGRSRRGIGGGRGTKWRQWVNY